MDWELVGSSTVALRTQGCGTGRVQARATAQAKAAAEGKSTLPGVFYDKNWGRWRVRTPQRWGVKRQVLASASSREEAEAIQKTYFSRLQDAATEGRFDEEIAAIIATLKAQVLHSVCYFLALTVALIHVLLLFDIKFVRCSNCVGDDNLL